MQIHYDARQLERFKKAARQKYPLEHLEILFGRASGEVIEILNLEKIPYTASVNSEGEEKQLDYEETDLNQLKDRLLKQGLEFIGTVHSHPDGGAGPPRVERKSRSSGGRFINGKLDFWIPQVPLPAVPIVKARPAPAATASPDFPIITPPLDGAGG